MLATMTWDITRDNGKKLSMLCYWLDGENKMEWNIGSYKIHGEIIGGKKGFSELRGGLMSFILRA